MTITDQQVHPPGGCTAARGAPGPAATIMTADPDRRVAVGGAGPHPRPGAHQARVGLDAPCREVSSRLPDLAPAGAVASLRSPSTPGPKSMPVPSTPRPRSTS